MSESCAPKSRVTADQFKQLVDREIPIGSTKPQVLAFLKDHQIQHSDYSQHPERESDFKDSRLDSKRALVKGYIKGIVRDVVSNKRFTEWSIELFFYFDENGILVDYHVKESGTTF